MSEDTGSGAGRVSPVRAAVALLVMLVFVGAGLAWWSSSRAAGLQVPTATAGTVVEVPQVRTPRKKWTRSKVVCQVVVEYRSVGGVPYRASSLWTGGNCRYRVGQGVPVVYDAADPSKTTGVLSSEVSGGGPPNGWMFGVAGLVIVVGALVWGFRRQPVDR